ncbi:hypothetical protein EDD29_0114 [Actinocorallia herbida]|uniref:Uncharacterized protein n=1 Tax=Actinocorallia herbida TaxID=58109 RepID=A0A3N1CMV4_9ACTN|nr:hypothetical protein [Actinocorallia herbida]ROO82633.1 hypothetical protein EDD29_0114 [Actinocorallia herbida]
MSPEGKPPPFARHAARRRRSRVGLIGSAMFWGSGFSAMVATGREVWAAGQSGEALLWWTYAAASLLMALSRLVFLYEEMRAR